MKRHVFSQLSCFKRESSDHIEQQQQILLHEIHIKVSFFYLTPLSESSMVLHTILLYTIYIGEFGSRWLLFIEAKLQQKRNNNAPPLPQCDQTLSPKVQIDLSNFKNLHFRNCVVKSFKTWRAMELKSSKA